MIVPPDLSKAIKVLKDYLSYVGTVSLIAAPVNEKVIIIPFGEHGIISHMLMTEEIGKISIALERYIPDTKYLTRGIVINTSMYVFISVIHRITPIPVIHFKDKIGLILPPIPYPRLTDET